MTARPSADGAPPVHFSQHAPSAAAASRVSARAASLFVCGMMRATLGLSPHELQPEMMRRCKTMQFEEEGDGTKHAEPAPSNDAVPSHAAIVWSLWKCIHSCLALEAMQPLALIEAGEILPATLAPPHSDAASSAAAAGISSFVAASAPTAPPLTALRDSWVRAIAQPDAMRATSLATLRSWGCDVPCVQHQPPERWNARQCLLVLDWCSERIGLRQRYERLMAGEHAHGFFHASPIAGAAAAAAAAPRASRASSSAPMQFTQPLLPPALYDSAAALGGSGLLDQSDEFRLLQQLLREAEARAAATAAVAPSSSMCLPPPSPSATAPSFASPVLPATAAVTALDSYADRRVSHRAFQCIALLGRLRTRLSKLSAVTSERSRVLLQLQSLQRHPALRGKMAATAAGAASPFEIQCAMAGRSSAATASTHASLRRWIDDAAVVSPVSSGSSSQLQDHWDRCSAVWRAWIDSVAAVQRQAEEEEEAAAAAGAQGDARVASSAAATAAAPIDSARATSARGASLPPHLRAAGSRTTAASAAAAGSRTARPAASSPALDLSLPEPSAAFWKAITHPLHATTSAAAAAPPTDLELLLRRWLRDGVGSYALSEEEREELQAYAADAAAETVAAPSSSSSSSAAASAAPSVVPSTLRWSAPSACNSLSLLAEAHRARDAQRRLAYCTLVEQAMLQAAEQGRAASSSSSAGSSRHRGKDRVAFTVHT